MPQGWWHFVLILGLAAWKTTFANEAANPDLTVEVNGICIIADTKDESLRAFDWPTGSGTAVSLLVKSPPGGLIQFDAKNSSLSRFTDEKENDLLARPATAPAQLGNIGFGMFAKVSKDGTSCVIEVHSPNIPTKGCATLKLEGVISMLSAATREEHPQKNIPIKNGSKLVAPAIEMLLDHVGKPDSGDEPLGLTLRSSAELDRVAEIRFFKTDGSEIKSRRVGTSKMGLYGALIVEWNYNLSENIDSADVKITLWTDLQKKKLPFKLNVNVGL